MSTRYGDRDTLQCFVFSFSYLCCFCVEDFLGCEKRLHVGDREEEPQVMKRWQLVVKFGVENLVCPLRRLHVFL